MEKTIKIVRTRKGLPALWEEGGGYSKTGKATIVANSDGSKKKPVYIRRRGHLACSHHALFIINKGDIIINTNHHRGDYHTDVLRIIDIREEEAVVEVVHSFRDGEWDKDPEGLIKE